MLMKGIRKFIALALAVSTAASVSAPVSAAGKSFNDVYADSSFSLLRHSMKSGRNCLISPASAFVAVSMAQLGASGKTRSEMEKAFGGLSTEKTASGLSKLVRRASKSGTAVFRCPSSVWYRKKAVSVKESYASVLKKRYSASIKGADFNSRTARDVNSWVSRNTEGKIKSVIDRINPSDRIILVNAAYFKGQWLEPYSGAKKRKFTKQNGNSEKVPMLEGSENEYFEVGGAKCFAKEYAGGRFSFVAVLPPKGTSVKSFLSKTSGSDVMKAYKGRRTSDVVVRTRIPKFRYSFETSLKKPLGKLGIKRAFTNSASFRNMTKSDVRIDDAVHKTFIALDENGTEAAAVTALVMKANSVGFRKPEVKTIYLNRPFLYEIVESDTGLPLFVGVVADP